MIYPAYSVLIRVCNTDKSEWLSIALDSMINQTVKPAEFVLVQDGPLTDDLQATIDRFKNEHPTLFKILPMQDQVGLGLALRQGVPACSNGFIACMDATGYSAPTRIEEEFDAMFENKVDMVGANVNVFVDTIDKVIAYRKYPETPERIYKYAKKNAPMNLASVLLKKRMVQVCENYENCYLAEDFALFINLLRLNAKGYNIQKPLVYKRYNNAVQKQHSNWMHFKAMVEFNQLFYKTGWFSYRDYIRRTIRIGVESFMPPVMKKCFANKSFGCRGV